MSKRILHTLCFSLLILPTLAFSTTPLNSWYSPSRLDNFASDWSGNVGNTRSPDYRMFRVEGHMVETRNFDPSTMVLLSAYYNDVTKDNALLPKSMRAPLGYRFVRDIGAAYNLMNKPNGSIALYLWYHAGRKDYFTTTNRMWAATLGSPDKAGYRFVGRVGHIIAPYKNVRHKIIRVPVSIYFEWDAINSEGDLVFGRNQHTYLEIVEQITKLNNKLEEAAGLDGRRIQFYIGKKVKYMQWVKLRGCPTARAMIENKYGKEGALNLLVTDKCNSANWSSDFAFVNEVSLVHEVGHAMGLFHTFDGNTTYVNARDWGQAEPLVRNYDPTKTLSCFRSGDRICDTMADYKIHDTDVNACLTTDLPCVQSGKRCDSSDLVFDGNPDNSCVRINSMVGRRTYDHEAPGLPTANIMSYRANTTFFTYQQFLVMYSTAKWRNHKAYDVPSDEKHIIRDPSNLGLDFWSRRADDDDYLRLR